VLGPLDLNKTKLDVQLIQYVYYSYSYSLFNGIYSTSANNKFKDIIINKSLKAYVYSIVDMLRD
jgi:hypothetical protein